MLKTLGFIFLVFILLTMFNTPVRNFMNNLLQREKAQLNEGQVIGTTLGYNPRVEEIQEILKDIDFDPGPTDGVMGSRTRGTIREFQKVKGLKVDGAVGKSTRNELRKYLE